MLITNEVNGFNSADARDATIAFIVKSLLSFLNFFSSRGTVANARITLIPPKLSLILNDSLSNLF